MTEELFDLIDEAGSVVGQAPRKRCHGDPSLLHRAVHVVIFHPQNGDILLQKRSMRKDIQPGKWDTAVGGHLDAGEDFLTAARREMREELGLDSPDLPLVHLFDSQIRNTVESENIRVFALRHAGPFKHDPVEIDEIRFWSAEEIREVFGKPDIFTPGLKAELQKLYQTVPPGNLC